MRKAYISLVARKAGRSLFSTRPLQQYGRRIHRFRSLQSPRSQSLETRFFRNPAQLDILRRLAHLWPQTSLRLAVIGCSTGAELYSAIWTVRSERPDIELSVTAVDIAAEAIEKARKAVYDPSDRELVAVPTTWSNRLLEPCSAKLKINPALREGIAWLIADATDPALPERMPLQNVVLANNFLIHMRASDAAHCFRNLVRLVTPGGYIFVSGADLDVRGSVAVELGLEPVVYRLEEVHRSDDLLKSGWPWEYWGLEPLDVSLPLWQTRYATVFRAAGLCKF
jgi:SAM-dependent methyltransferase